MWEKALGETSPVTPGPATGACLDGPTGEATLGLGGVKIWMGLANSDSVGLRIDLRAEVSVNGAPIGSGEVLDVPAGTGSGPSRTRCCARSR